MVTSSEGVPSGLLAGQAITHPQPHSDDPVKDPGVAQWR